MCVVQGWRVVGAIACHSNHLATLLEKADKALLVAGACARHDTEVAEYAQGLVVRETAELRTGYRPASLSPVILRPAAYAYLPSYLACGGVDIASDNLHVYTSVMTLAYGAGNIRADRVGYAEDGLHVVCPVAVLEGESESAHGFRLVALEDRLDADALRGWHLTLAHHYLRRSLQVAPLRAVGHPYRCHHLLRLCRERLLARHSGGFSQMAVLLPVTLHPHQRGGLSRVADAFSIVQMRRRVGGYALIEPVAVVVIYLTLCHLHLVLGQSACLVGAYDGDGTHRLTCVQLPDKVVALQHTAHVKGERERDGHGQTLRDGHHDERYGHHEIFQDDSRHAQIISVRAAYCRP